MPALKNKTVFCDLPAYVINKNLLSDIGQYTETINVVTDDAEITKQRVNKFSVKESAMKLGINLKHQDDINIQLSKKDQLQEMILL